MNPNDPAGIPAEIAALVTAVDDLGEAITNADEGFTPVSEYDTQASASATAALASKGTAATAASNALASANAAAGSATTASTAQTNAATAVTNSGNSASAAAASATAADGNVTTAATGATNATNSNTAAQGYATHAKALKQVAVPSQVYSGTGGGPTNANYPVSISFTAPCNGYAIAFGALNLASTGSAEYTLTMTIAGTQVFQDSSEITLRAIGMLAVTTGQAVTITLTASATTAPSQNAGLHLLGFFIPSAT
jgi:hypothetical protein